MVVSDMSLVRILVDGFSLLHGWPELVPGQPRHSVTARDTLVMVLTQYQDACGTPITIVFDGRGPHRSGPKTEPGSVEGAAGLQG